MYLREKLIKVLKVKNMLLKIFGWFNFFLAIYLIAAMFAYYYDDVETAMRARATSDGVVSLVLGVAALIIAALSKKLLGEARFFSSYFEGDLDGYISYSDLAAVTEKSVGITAMEVKLCKILYMKGFTIDDSNTNYQIILDRKTYSCQCRNCGAPIEKAMYFTGKCAYCGSSDLHAGVVTNNRFYSISSHVSEGMNNPEFYTIPRLHKKCIGKIVSLGLTVFMTLILFIYSVSTISHYNNKSYMREQILSGKGYSYDLINRNTMDNFIFGIIFCVGFAIVTYFTIRKFISILTAKKASDYFAECKRPFVEAKGLSKRLNRKKAFAAVDEALRMGYMKNFTFEKHDKEVKIALAKQIVKDKCPSCNGPIIDAVDENYTCQYCGSRIMGVVTKKI